MISGDVLAAMLHALSTGFADRALNLVVSAEDLEDEDLRHALHEAIVSNETPAEQVVALGDAFRDAGADQFLVNECYRAAFYLGDRWSELAANPLYAHFIANRAGPVLDKWPHYFPIYARHLERFRGRQLKILEIGVYRGGGLELWQNYLGPGASVVGLDIDEAAVRAARGRYPVVLGDQEDPEVLRGLEREHGPFDIVIDDGGHTMGQQIVSIETLFPLLNNDGIYLVEDCHTSYWPQFGGALGSSGSFIEWAKGRVDELHSRHLREIDRTTVWATDLDGVYFYDSVVVFGKQARFRPFSEVVGTSSYLFGDRFSEAVGIELLATRDVVVLERDRLRAELDRAQSGLPSADGVPGPQGGKTTAAAPADEELRFALAELRRAKETSATLSDELRTQSAELTNTRNQLLESWEQVKALRGSASWRATSPLRAIRRLGSR